MSLRSNIIRAPRTPRPGPTPGPGPGPFPPGPSGYELAYLGTSPVFPGATLIFDLTGPAVAEGRPGRFRISGVSASDIEGGRLTGTFVVGPDGSTFLEIKIADGAVFTPGEALTLTVFPPGSTALSSEPISTSNFNPDPGPNPGATFTLTTNIETIPVAGVVAPANAVFSAPAGVTPQGAQANTLQSGDVLNGSGQQNVLNATLVAAGAIAPTINNIPTVNITSLVAGANLNVGASTNSGLTTLGDVNSVADVNVAGVTTALTTLNKSGGIRRNTEVLFQNNVLTAPNNALQINLSGVDGGNIRAESGTPTSTNGYETFNVAATTASSIGRLISGGSLDNINISGANLSIRGAAGFDALEPSLLSLNASAMTGSLTVGRINNGVDLSQAVSTVNAGAEDLNFVGSNNGTTLFVDSASLAQGDVLNGGAGAGGNLVLTGNGANGVVQGNNSAFTATGFETLTITDTAGNGVAARAFNNPANFNLTGVSGVNTVQLGTASNAVVGLTNFQYTSPLAINVTGNGESTVNAANGVNAVFFGAFGDADTVNYTFGNKGAAISTNNNINNGALNLAGIENINLTYNDFTSNTRVTNQVFAGGSTDSLRFISVTAASGDTDAGAINLGIIGNNSVRGGQFASNAAVTSIIRTFDGALFITSGAGDHNLTVTAELSTASINGDAGTGDQRFAAAIPATANGRVQFTGGSGDDTLIGGTANDILSGNSGDDRMEGRGGVDVLSGGDNSDVLTGGANIDVLTGGSGADVFNGRNLGLNGADLDTITDFSRAQGDTFNLDAAVAILNGARFTGANAAASIQAAPVNTPGAFIAAANTSLLTTVGNVGDSNAANSLNGTNLLAAITAGNTPITTVAGQAANNNLLLFAVDSTAGAVLYFGDSGANATFEAAEITQIGVLNGVTTASLLATDFSNVVIPALV